ncbi:MAG: hypothetical protein NZM37_02905 [Sandaracinaceae bacterium]|nr:hypothetical protein [Sandaracinaceae bacterium]MDW8245581.1 hypothetical protein [Sandaracinaceae bacterium]
MSKPSGAAVLIFGVWLEALGVAAFSTASMAQKEETPNEAESSEVENTSILPDRYHEATEKGSEENELPPPPPPRPPFRLRVGGGVAVPVMGASELGFRAHEELEWSPEESAPLWIGFGAFQVFASPLMWGISGRIGLLAPLERERRPAIEAALGICPSLWVTQGSLAFDLGGEGDLRFRFEWLELHLRLGFGGANAWRAFWGSGGIGLTW